MTLEKFQSLSKIFLFWYEIILTLILLLILNRVERVRLWSKMLFFAPLEFLTISSRANEVADILFELPKLPNTDFEHLIN